MYRTWDCQPGFEIDNCGTFPLSSSSSTSVLRHRHRLRFTPSATTLHNRGFALAIVLVTDPGTGTRYIRGASPQSQFSVPAWQPSPSNGQAHWLVNLQCCSSEYWRTVPRILPSVGPASSAPLASFWSGPRPLVRRAVTPSDHRRRILNGRRQPSHCTTHTSLIPLSIHRTR